MLSADRLSWRIDPCAFARACGMEPDRWQLTVLNSTSRQLCMLCSRQAGKTTTTAVLALKEAVLTPASLTLIYARAQRQAVELLRKCKEMLHIVGQAAPPLTSDNEQSIEFATGSRIIALPGSESTVRGFSAPKLVIFDEAARVSDELYFAARPMLAVSQGRLVLLSSAWNESGFFYDVVTASDAGWDRIHVPATECPRLSKEWLAEERDAIGDRAYRREYLCQFGATDESVFSRELVQQFFTSRYPPLHPAPLRVVA